MKANALLCRIFGVENFVLFKHKRRNGKNVGRSYLLCILYPCHMTPNITIVATCKARSICMNQPIE